MGDIERNPQAYGSYRHRLQCHAMNHLGAVRLCSIVSQERSTQGWLHLPLSKPRSMRWRNGSPTSGPAKRKLLDHAQNGHVKSGTNGAAATPATT